MEEGKIARVDTRNRLSLGHAVQSGRWYSIDVEDDGVVVLTPLEIVPKRQLVEHRAAR